MHMNVSKSTEKLSVSSEAEQVTEAHQEGGIGAGEDRCFLMLRDPMYCFPLQFIY